MKYRMSSEKHDGLWEDTHVVLQNDSDEFVFRKALKEW